jgi:antitoxin PrlF
MIERTAKITSKGQITIPQEIRQALKLREGDTVTFTVHEGEATLKPNLPTDPFSTWAGAWREGEGKTREDILAEERDARGW